MEEYPASRIDPSISQVLHIKIQALTLDHLRSEIWGGGYSDYLEYDFPQDEGYESDAIMVRQKLANMTAKTGKYDGDQLFHAISRDNNTTTVHFMFCLHLKLEVT